MKKIISYIFLTLTLILGCAFAVQAAETEHKPADIPGLTFDHSMSFPTQRNLMWITTTMAMR